MGFTLHIIKSYAEENMENPIYLTDKECLEILHSIEHDHNCEYGITWQHIENEIRNFKNI